MSRIGKAPIPIPSGVDVTIDGRAVSVKGPRGELSLEVAEPIRIEADGEELRVLRPDDERRSRALHGLMRSLVNNMVLGVTKGFERKLQIIGVGYRAVAPGPGSLELQLGYSHTITYVAPDGVTFDVPAPTEITVKGIDKQVVGQVAAEIRAKRPPEPYKGKGIRYVGERVIRKAGKSAAGAEA